MAVNDNDDLEAQGLIVRSYDSLFSVRKRLRKINDIHIPMKRGIATNQIGAFFVTMFISLIVYGLIVVPLVGILGLERSPWVMLILVVGPAVLVAQRVTKPMAHGKSITGAAKSFLRRHLDDPVHRRGLPIPTPSRPLNEPVQHYQREWAPYEDLVDSPDEQDWSDEVTEARLRGDVVALQPWLERQAREHHNEERRSRRERDSRDDSNAHFKRGPASSVHIPDDGNESSQDEEGMLT